MKIIDLLNKIANGEQPPIKIKYGSRIFKLDYIGYKQASYLCDGKCLLEGWNTTMCLTDEVEIIKEDKEIEKLERVNGSDLVDLQKNSSLVDQNKAVANLIMYLNMNVVKINELIDELNKLKVSK